jgi:hypothetical protein
MSSSRTYLGLILGAILIGAGILFLFGEISGLISLGLLWPLIVVAIGIAFFIGMLLGGPGAGPLAIPGSILIIIGLILFVQNAFNTWETWTYAWALIIVAVGIGIWIHGAWSKRPELRLGGQKLIQTGLVLFVVFGLLLSLIFSYFGIAEGNFTFWGLLVAALGLYLLMQRSILLMQGHAGWDDRDLFWPVIMIGVGVTLFLYGLGELPLLQLTGLLQWWPLALVMIGFDWLIGKRWPLVGAIIAVLIVVATMLLMFDPALLKSLSFLGHIERVSPGNPLMGARLKTLSF